MGAKACSVTALVCLMGSVATGQSTATNLVTGVITVPGQRDNYVFSLAAGSRFYFDSLTNSAAVLWSLTGPEGAVVTDQPFSSSDAQSINDPTVALPSSMGIQREPDTRFKEVLNAWLQMNRGNGQIREWLLEGIAKFGITRDQLPPNLTF